MLDVPKLMPHTYFHGNYYRYKEYFTILESILIILIDYF